MFNLFKKSLRTFDDDPNFTIVVPGGCNAKCDFCFWEKQTTPDDYLSRLDHVLENLPKKFEKLSISGGEPTISKHFDDILTLVSLYGDRFNHIVLTTNGTGLEKHFDRIATSVDFINISRHHWDDNISNQIFGTESIPSKEELRDIVEEYNKIDIPVRVNCVLTDKLNSKEDIEKMIEFSQYIGASSIAFRKQHGELVRPDQMAPFNEYILLHEGGCPVCRTWVQRIKGFEVHWKASQLEPKEYVPDIYELVFHPTGRLTRDWSDTDVVEI